MVYAMVGKNKTGSFPVEQDMWVAPQLQSEQCPIDYYKSPIRVGTHKDIRIHSAPSGGS